MRQWRRTDLIAVLGLAILVGLGLARRADWAPSLALMIAAAPLLLLLKRKNIWSLYLIILLGLGAGLARGQIYEQKLYQLQTLANHQVSLTGTVTTDSIYGKNSQITFDLNHVRLAGGSALAGNFAISGFGEHIVYRGDQVQVSGKLYTARGSHQAAIYYGQIKRIGISTSWVNSLTRRFNAGEQNALPEPLASFGLGLLIGQRSTMPADIITQLTMVGLIHIVAVSGYNVTILARAAARLRLRSRYQQLLASLSLIGLFVLVTGFSASIVRAAFVSGLTLWAWYFGRQIRPIVLISVAAAVTAWLNPFYVWGDISWYLSFLAFFGVMVVAPLIQNRLFQKPTKLATTVLIETLSAELMTLPLIVTYFSQLSLVAPLANLLIVPLVPVAMLLAAIAAVAGAVVPTLAGWVAWPARILLTYMLDIVHLLAGIPAGFARVSASAAVMVIFYALVLIVVNGLRRGVRRRLATKA